MATPQLINLHAVTEHLKTFAKNEGLCIVTEKEERGWISLLNQINLHMLTKDAGRFASLKRFWSGVKVKDDTTLTQEYETFKTQFEAQTKRIHAESKVAHEALLAKAQTELSGAKRTVSQMTGKNTSENPNTKQKTEEVVVDQPIKKADTKKRSASTSSDEESVKSTTPPVTPVKKQKVVKQKNPETDPRNPDEDEEVSDKLEKKDNENKSGTILKTAKPNAERNPKTTATQKVTLKIKDVTLEEFVYTFMKISCVKLWETAKSDDTLKALSAAAPDVGKQIKPIFGDLYILTLFTPFMQKLEKNANTPFISLFNSDSPAIKDVEGNVANWTKDFWMNHPRGLNGEISGRMTPQQAADGENWIMKEGNGEILLQVRSVMRLVFLLKASLYGKDDGYSKYEKGTHSLKDNAEVTVFDYQSIASIRKTFSFRPEVLDAIIGYLRTKIPKVDGELTLEAVKKADITPVVMTTIFDELKSIYTKVLPEIAPSVIKMKPVTTDPVKDLIKTLIAVALKCKGETWSWRFSMTNLRFALTNLEKIDSENLLSTQVKAFDDVYKNYVNSGKTMKNYMKVFFIISDEKNKKLFDAYIDTLP